VPFVGTIPIAEIFATGFDAVVPATNFPIRLRIMAHFGFAT
jgi:hypothetical protein